MTKKLVDYSLYLVTNEKLVGGSSLSSIVKAAISGGVTIVQYREKDASTSHMIEQATLIHKVTKAAGVPLIIDDRIDVMLAVGAEGVHVGQSDMPADLARKLIGPDKILGVTAKNVEQAIKAECDGADYLGCGDIFGTTSKDDAGKPIGLDGFRDRLNSVSIPVVGIGGITIDNAASVIQTGADGVAVISAIISHPDPKFAAEQLCINIRAAK
jgi:thiamine-phosphate pyrophosphorylase